MIQYVCLVANHLNIYISNQRKFSFGSKHQRYCDNCHRNHSIKINDGEESVQKLLNGVKVVFLLIIFIIFIEVGVVKKSELTCREKLNTKHVQFCWILLFIKTKISRYKYFNTFLGSNLT